MSENTPTHWGYVSCDDGHYLICTDRVPVTDTNSTARVIGTAKDKDTAVLMAAAPDMYKLMKSVVDFDHTAFKFDTNGNLVFTREKYNEFHDLITEIDGKEAE